MYMDQNIFILCVFFYLCNYMYFSQRDVCVSTVDCTLLTLFFFNCLQLPPPPPPPLSLSLSLSLSLTFSVYPLSCFLSLSLSLFFFSLSLSANSSPLSLTYKVINSPGLKLRYNQGFVIDPPKKNNLLCAQLQTHSSFPNLCNCLSFKNSVNTGTIKARAPAPNLRTMPQREHSHF